MRDFDCIVIGGGAAGLYGALTAGQRGRRVLVLEHNREVGAKILISGGGRCNFTNVEAGKAERFLSANPHFARSALARHTPGDFIALVEKHKIGWYEKTLGQLFCEGVGAAKKIVRMLMDECAAGGVEVRTGVRVSAVTKADGFSVETDAGAFRAPALVIATGGLSIPKMGATDFSHRIAARFGVAVVAPRPGLVPLTFEGYDLKWMQQLAGLSTPVVIDAGGVSFREAALFTHRGLSGPAILQASSYWVEKGRYFLVDWLPDVGEDVLVQAKRTHPGALPRTATAAHVPERLAVMLCGARPPRPLGQWRDQDLIHFARQLKRAPLKPAGTEGYAKAEVTVGGVDTDALSQKTMESKAVPGLFFIGEAVDVTGWLGGYNFQWAWASGHAAGMAV